MPYSYAVYTGNGTNDQFTVSFPYIRKEHVFASVNYVNATFTWVNNSTIKLDAVPGNGTRVEVRRVTPVANPLVDFTDGSTLVAADLDTNALQQTYINQEQDDQIRLGIYVDANGNLTAGGQRIQNVADPTAAQDAATKNYVDTQDNLRLKRDGTQAMTGALNAGGFKVQNIAEPTASHDAASKNYVDTTTVASAGDSMTGPLAMGGNKITGLGDPINPQDAATKTWVETANTSPLQQFRSIFYGAFATDQATDPFGAAPTEGDLYFNTTLDQMRVFNGASWQEASADATITRFKFTAVGGETSLSGNDDNAQSLTYNVGLEMVYLNGALLTRGVDYVATTGSSITGLVALAAADLVEVVAFSQIDAIGSIPSANSTFLQSGTGAVQRTVESKLKDVASVKDFGAVGDGVADDLAAIDLAVGSGKSLSWPQGVYRVTSTIRCTTSQTWTALGEVEIRYDAAAASAAAPVLDFVGEVHISGDFIINHQAHVKNFGTPSISIYNGDVITGSAILIQADYSTVDSIKVVNAWDNGIAVVKVNAATGAITQGSPKYVVIDGVRSNNCGCGNHVSPPAMQSGKVGAGIDIGSGSACVVSNCVDVQSYNGFILDLGAGGQCQFSNCTAFYTRLDNGNPTGGSGWGFYVGSGDSTYTNCYSIGAERGGFWYDGTAQNCDFTNCAAYIPAREGLYIKGPKAIFSGFRVKEASFGSSNVHPAITIDSSGAAIDNLLLNVQVTGSSQKYGLYTTGANTIDAKVEGILVGVTGNVFKNVTSGSHDLGLFLTDPTTSNKATYGGSAFGFEHEFTGKLRINPPAGNSAYGTQPFGDFQNNGTFFIPDFAAPSKRAAFGYDPTNDGFVIQSIHAGTATKTMFLNPSGGAVMVGKGEWTAPMRLGSYYLWVDGGGKLRIKSGAPANDGDGTIVGTQS